jgi:hypothetical protein
MTLEKQFRTTGSRLRTGTGEPLPALTDVSLRHVGVVQGWSVPEVPTSSANRELVRGECEGHGQGARARSGTFSRDAREG